ncbi:MAG: nucleotidyltransferase domain-containing protein [Deltaproteobacteria bacterium]|nr:nucleotidyltransferase domain-containing protein [Deltaproteobacteria bacterium]
MLRSPLMTSTGHGPAVVGALSRALSGRRDVLVAVLFGSEARGRAGPDSDVDLAVLAPGVDLVDLAVALSSALGRDVDVVSLDDAPVPLLAEVVQHGLVAHEGRPGAAAGWWASALADLETDLPWYRRMSRAWLEVVAAGGLAGGQR